VALASPQNGDATELTVTVIRPYTPSLEPAVAEFNGRLKARGSAWSLRTSAPAPEATWSAFVAVDTNGNGGKSIVRGGYIGIRHPFWVNGEEVDVYHIKLPLSEGTVDSQHNAVGLQLLVDAQRRYPLSFALGMGGRKNVLPQILKSLGWRLLDVPFFFRIVHPSRFFREAAFLRTSRLRRLALDFFAASRLGHIPLAVQAWRGRRAWRVRGGDGNANEVGDWNDCDFVDRIWKKGRSPIAFAARRDAASLRELYPATDRRFLRLRVDRAGQAVGWAVVLDTQLAGHKRLGNVRLGSLADGFALPGEERHVVRAATRFLARRGVDVMVANQSASGWCKAMLANGWFESSSNYVLALSKPLAARLDGNASLHITRGDGDGPINL
jgi:hypothetical protein